MSSLSQKRLSGISRRVCGVLITYLAGDLWGADIPEFLRKPSPYPKSQWLGHKPALLNMKFESQ